jgi:tetratricopeptide (TPR) repeat protein
MDIALAATVVGTIIGVIMLVLYLVHRNAEEKKRRHAYFEVIWRHAGDLTPGEVLGARGDPNHGFHDYYYSRDIDEALQRQLDEGKNTIVIGRPLAGKTRAIYQALKSLGDTVVVTIPRLTDIDPTQFEIPKNTTNTPREIVLFDDIGKFLDRPGCQQLLRECVRRKCLILATCWESQWEALRQRLESEAGLHFSGCEELGIISEQEARDIAARTGKPAPHHFDGKIGSIFLELDEMKRRFREDCGPEEREYLKAVSRLYQAGVYAGRELFDPHKVRTVAENLHELKGELPRWRSWQDKLMKLGFCERQEKGLHLEEAYLSEVVNEDFKGLADLRSLLGVFRSDPSVALSIGYTASERSLVLRETEAYTNLAVDAYATALDNLTHTSDPKKFAWIQASLGIAYANLANVRDVAENCELAIGALRRALEFYSFEDYPTNYAMTQHNLGNTYGILARVRRKAENCHLAIEAYQEALRVYTLENSPIGFASTQNSLGSTYGILAEAYEKAENCNKAIDAFLLALRVRTFESLPVDYASTQNNLGNTYRSLAEVRDRAENCEHAIKAYKEALRVYSFVNFPMDYAMTQNNLGNAQASLALVHDKEKNCKKAMESYLQALRVYSIEDFPIDYAMTQNNLGIAHSVLVEICDKVRNCELAIEAFQRALQVRTVEHYPISYAESRLNSGFAFMTWSAVQNTLANCRQAQDAFADAARVFADHGLPDLEESARQALAWSIQECGGDFRDSSSPDGEG